MEKKTRRRNDSFHALSNSGLHCFARLRVDFLGQRRQTVDRLIIDWTAESLRGEVAQILARIFAASGGIFRNRAVEKTVEILALHPEFFFHRSSNRSRQNSQ